MKKKPIIYVLLTIGAIYYGMGMIKYYNPYKSNNSQIHKSTSVQSTWNLRLITKATTSAEAISKLQKDKKILLKILQAYGIDSNDISEKPIIIEDKSKYYKKNVTTNNQRFSATMALFIHPKNHEKKQSILRNR